MESEIERLLADASKDIRKGSQNLKALRADMKLNKLEYLISFLCFLHCLFPKYQEVKKILGIPTAY